MIFPKMKWLVGKNIDGNAIAQGPVVYPIIPPNGPWSGQNCLGNSVQVNPQQQYIQSVLKMDEWGPPEVWTIALGIELSSSAEALSKIAESNWDAKAHIDFGVGGTTEHIDVDWRNGMTIPLVMNSVNVGVTITKAFNQSPLQIPIDLRLTCQLARGNSGKVLPVTYTVLTPNMNDIPDVIIGDVLPKYAQRVKIDFFDPAINPFVASTELELVTAAISGAALKHITTVTDEHVYEVPSGARGYNITDAAAAPNRTKAFRMIFELGL